MDLRRTIKELKELQNPMEDYADMVGAPAFAHGFRYVFPERTDYIIQDAIDILEKVDKYRWHDLRENPDDLPEESKNEEGASDDVLVMTSGEDFPMVAYIDLESRIWEESLEGADLENFFGDVIAWKYIEPFENLFQRERIHNYELLHK